MKYNFELNIILHTHIYIYTYVQNTQWNNSKEYRLRYMLSSN